MASQNHKSKATKNNMGKKKKHQLTPKNEVTFNQKKKKNNNPPFQNNINSQAKAETKQIPSTL